MSDSSKSGSSPDTAPSSPLLVGLAWLAVGTPIAYGLWQTILRAAKLFAG